MTHAVSTQYGKDSLIFTFDGVNSVHALFNVSRARSDFCKEPVLPGLLPTHLIHRTHCTRIYLQEPVYPILLCWHINKPSLAPLPERPWSFGFQLRLERQHLDSRLLNLSCLHRLLIETVRSIFGLRLLRYLATPSITIYQRDKQAYI